MPTTVGEIWDEMYTACSAWTQSSGEDLSPEVQWQSGQHEHGMAPLGTETQWPAEKRVREWKERGEG